MSDKFQNKYRIPSARLQNWDYRSNGAYFITLCTRNREHYFGEITDAQFVWKPAGLLAEKYWLEIPQHFIFVELGSFVIMPDHIHGILILNHTETENYKSGIDRILEQPRDSSASALKNKKMADISPKTGAISTIIRSYKSVVSKQAHLIPADFGWQTRYYDHIIRDSKSFERIQNYIENNINSWDKDKGHP
ncbi:MAG: transposase [Bacteroidota bacterium]